MPRPRFDKLPAERREHILEVAGEAFAAKGFRPASYNAIIQKTGVSKGSFYYYFDDKLDLFATVLMSHFARVDADLGALWEGAEDDRPFWEQVHELIGRLVRVAVVHPQLVMLVKGGMGLWKEDALHPIAAEAGEHLARILVAGQAASAIRTDLPMELLMSLSMAVGEALDTHLLHQIPADSVGLPQPSDEEVWGMLDLFQRLLRPADEG